MWVMVVWVVVVGGERGGEAPSPVWHRVLMGAEESQVRAEGSSIFAQGDGEVGVVKLVGDRSGEDATDGIRCAGGWRRGGKLG
jgi:hypothetical protein